MADTNYTDFEQPTLPLKEFEEMENTEAEQNENQEPPVITKLLTIILSGDSELHMNLMSEHFEGSSEDEIKTIVSRILQTASMRTLEESKAFMEDKDWSNFNTPINNGSLYDEIIFESSIYVDANHEIIPNTTFGKQCDPSVPLHESLREVSDGMLYIANDMNKLESLDMDEEASILNGDNNSIDTLEVDSSFQNRF